MKYILLLLTIASLLSANGCLADGFQYKLRVDGLACPYCAYGIEKKLMHTQGVTAVIFDLDKGLVMLSTVAGKHFTEEALKKIIHNAGFTLRHYERLRLPRHNNNKK